MSGLCSDPKYDAFIKYMEEAYKRNEKYYKDDRDLPPSVEDTETTKQKGVK